MTMIPIRLIVCVLGVLLLAGCPGNDAKVLFENAAFEESHMNYENAKRIYEQIVAQYPSSKEAEIARVRLESLKESMKDQ